MLNELLGMLRAGVIEIVATIALAVISLAGAYALAYIRRAQAALEARTEAEILDRTIARAAALAESTVLAFESTIAKELRKAVEAGNASRAELLAIGERAVEDVLKHLGKNGQQVLADTVGDVRDYVKDLVEAQVERLKQQVIQIPFDSQLLGSESRASN